MTKVQLIKVPLYLLKGSDDKASDNRGSTVFVKREGEKLILFKELYIPEF